MNTSQALLAVDSPDAELVALSLTGDREAFGLIVERYQSLICSLAYSGTGNLAQSEDLAQDTFITAWRNLPELHEPERLRAWLCGIVRNLIKNLRRQQGHEPTHAAEPLESANAATTSDLSPPSLAIRHDEETLLWRAVEQIPETYREPLILFYRQNQSIEGVAASLDLSEDAVKQRLSRGRKLLHDEVLAIVEGALARTRPGPAFTSGVLLVLPALPVAGKAAILGATAAKGASATNVSGALGGFGSIIGPTLGVFAGWLWTLIGIRNMHTLSKSRMDLSAQPATLTDPQRKELRKKIVARRRKLFKAGMTLFAANLVILVSLFLGMYLDGRRAHFRLMTTLVFTSIALIAVGAIWRFWQDTETFQIAWMQFKLMRSDPKVIARREAMRPLRETAQAKLKGDLLKLPLTLLKLPFDLLVEIGKELKSRWTADRMAFLRDAAELAILGAVTWIWALWWTERPLPYNAFMLGSGLVLVTLQFKRSHRDSRVISRDQAPPLIASGDDPEFFEYRSRWALLGCPLIHVNYGTTPDGKLRKARGWIAVGTIATGLIAIGGATAGLVSIGLLSIGVLSVGMFGALGLFAIGFVAAAPFAAVGGLAISYWAVGGAAIGWHAFGGIALAWRASHGVLAIARDLAVGRIALASHVHSQSAQAFMADHGFWPQTTAVFQSFWSFWLPVFLNLWVVGLLFPDDDDKASSNQTD